MNRIACAALIGGLAAGPLLSMPARADDPGGKSGFSDRMKEKLGLTDDQAQKLQAAFKAQREAVKPLREQLKASMKKLKEQLKAKASDKDIQATLDELKKGRDAMRGEMEKFRASVESALSPSQRAKMLVWRMKHMRRAFAGRRGGMGCGCGGGHGGRRHHDSDDDGEAGEE